MSENSAVEAATQIMTGITHNAWIDFIILPLILAAILTWAFRAQIFRFQEWFSKKSGIYGLYKTDKVLKEKIMKAKVKEISDIKEEKTME